MIKNCQNQGNKENKNQIEFKYICKKLQENDSVTHIIFYFTTIIHLANELEYLLE